MNAPDQTPLVQMPAMVAPESFLDADAAVSRLEALYAQAQAGASGGGPTATPGDDDEVVEDADYEVIDEDEAAKTT